MRFDQVATRFDQRRRPVLPAHAFVEQAGQQRSQVSIEKVALGGMHRIRRLAPFHGRLIQGAQDMHELQLHREMVGQFGLLLTTQAEVLVKAHQFLEQGPRVHARIGSLVQRGGFGAGPRVEGRQILRGRQPAWGFRIVERGGEAGIQGAGFRQIVGEIVSQGSAHADFSASSISTRVSRSNMAG